MSQQKSSLLLLLLFVLLPVTAAISHPTNSQFINPEEYLKLHPEEQEISKKFSKTVKELPHPLRKGQQKKTVSIAFVYPGEQASDYWQRSVRSFVARMDALQIDYKLDKYFSKAGGIEIRKQEQQLKTALDKDPDYLVFTLDVNQHQRLIERILAKGRPHLILQNITTPLSIWEGNQPFYVGFDHAIGTRILADYFLDQKTDNGTYGLLYFSQGYVSSMRGDTFQTFMREGKGYELSAAYYTGGQREKSRKAAEQLIRKDTNLRLIYACATDVALGATDALRDAGLTGEIMVNGWGGGSAELVAIARGELTATVMRMNDDNGVAMAEAIRLQLLGKGLEIPTVFSGDFVLITGETSEGKIQAAKKQAFRYSGIPDNL